ncbi:MAG: mechanosensitive ion channel family protein [Candidatus Micrarchaeia archaeon]
MTVQKDKVKEKDKVLNRGYLRKHSIRVILIALIVFIGLYIITKYFAITPANNGQEIALSAIIGILGIELLGFILYVSLKSTVKGEEANTLRNLFRIIGYSILILFLLSLLSVNITGLLLSAGFLGIVLGLAAQSTLSNFIAGVYLLSSKAFEPGDRVTIHTWQYNMVPQSYPHDKFVPGFFGRIKNIGLLYTELTNDENIPVYVPNSIVVQALVLNYGRAPENIVRLQFDLSIKLDYETVKKIIKGVLEKRKITDYSVNIEYLHNDIYVITVHLIYEFKDRRELRSEIYEKLLKEFNKKSVRKNK